MTPQLAIIPGDGIGPEVITEARKVLSASGFEYDAVEYDLGAARFSRTGEVLPDSVLHELAGVDAILLGAIGAPSVPPGLLERGLLLRLRFEFDLYVNLRPVRLLPGAPNLLTGKGPDDVDFIVVRENTEGPYVGEGGFLRKGTPTEVATQGSVNSRFGVERCVRYAFDLARARPRQRLTLCHKTNVLTFAGDLWQRTFDEVATGYPDVSTGYLNVALPGDYGMAWLLTRLVGTSRARELMFTAERVTAARCEAIGLVNRVVPDDELDAAVDELALRLSRGPTIALSMTKRLLNNAFTSSLAEALEAEAMAQAVNSSTHDTTEGLLAFVEKRAAEFKGN